MLHSAFAQCTTAPCCAHPAPRPRSGRWPNMRAGRSGSGFGGPAVAKPKQTFVLWPDPIQRARVGRNLMDALKALPKDKAIRVTIQDYEKNRSLAQNAYYWGVVLPSISEHIEAQTGEVWSCDELHEWYRDKFLPPRVVTICGEPKILRPSTASLKVKPFAEYLDRIIRYCSINLGHVVPAPEEDVGLPDQFRRSA